MPYLRVLTISRKLSILHPQDKLPLVLSFSDYVEAKSNGDTENLHTDEFQSHIGTFLSYLAFWQDVLEHCRSADVRHTLIDHFHVLFLQQLLSVEVNRTISPTNSV